MFKRSVWPATAAAVVFASAPALAQQAPAKPQAGKPAAAPPTVGEVTVQGTAPPVRTSIDRQSYSVANDLQATTGSISDALRNVPSVEVDVNGNVSLRGDANVTILIDGKPSGIFRGEGRGQALQNLPADQIDRVEVITNPSAAFNPEGSAGVINLVTKQKRALGYTGSVRANYGSMGRYNGGASGSYNNGKVTLSGDVTYRNDAIKQEVTGFRNTVDLTGLRHSALSSISSGEVRFVNGRMGIDYDPDAKTRLSAELRVFYLDFDIDSAGPYREVSGTGAPLRIYDRFGPFEQTRTNVEGTVSYRKKFADDHELTASFARERQEEDRRRLALTDNHVPMETPDVYEDLPFAGLNWRTQAKVDYSRPLPGGVKLKVGYAFDADDNDYDNLGFRGPSLDALAPDPSLINLFHFDQQVHAAYITYERPFGEFTALAGLRAEATLIDIDQVTQHLTAENDYTRLYPSLHLRYELSETQQLRASYSRRIQRPGPQDYNPFRVYQDPQNFREGNPDLKPQQTDSFEVGYQRRKNGTTLLATLYYRDVRDAVNDVTRDLGGGVFLTTRENIGQSRSAGLELVASGRLTRKLTYNVSGNAYWTEIDGSGLGFGSATRDAATLFGRANLSWQVTDKDFLQLNAFMNGKRLTPQGYFEPVGGLNLGYRHKLNDKVALVLTAQDVLSTLREKRVLETPTFRDVQRYEPKNRGVFVGVTYTFGGRQRDPGFDFGGGGAPGN